MANTGQFKHLDQDQAWAYVHAAKCGDEGGLKVVSAWSNEAKFELAAVGLFGRRQDEQDFRSCLEYYTEGGLPPTWPVDDVQRGLEKLGVPDPSPSQTQPAQPAPQPAAQPSAAPPAHQPAQPQVAQLSPAPAPQPAPSPAAPPTPAPPAQPAQRQAAQPSPAQPAHAAPSPAAPPTPAPPAEPAQPQVAQPSPAQPAQTAPSPAEQPSPAQPVPANTGTDASAGPKADDSAERDAA